MDMIKFKNSLFLIPYFFTFANAILGLLAVFKALDCDFIIAAYCILLAAFMDCFDGRLARAFGSSSVLGMELDSLSDAISFCVAPAVLLYTWDVQDFGYFGIIALMIYLCAGIFRLAKFNVTCSTKQSNCFLGLPTPIAAFFLVSFVLYEEWLSNRAQFILNKNVLLGLIIFISFLMISTIPFPSFKKKNNKRMIFMFFFLSLLGFVAFLRGYPLFMLIPVGYILMAFSMGFYSKSKRYLKFNFR
jgi:CDP-diacylglycerol---serine O-phosphatidyltransferase